MGSGESGALIGCSTANCMKSANQSQPNIPVPRPSLSCAGRTRSSAGSYRLHHLPLSSKLVDEEYSQLKVLMFNMKINHLGRVMINIYLSNIYQLN